MQTRYVLILLLAVAPCLYLLEDGEEKLVPRDTICARFTAGLALKSNITSHGYIVWLELVSIRDKMLTRMLTL